MRSWRFLLAPWWFFALGTSAKSFADNPVIGSPELNAQGLHAARVRLAATLAQARRRRLARRIDPGDVADFQRDGFILKRDFLPPDDFAMLRDQVLGHAARARETVQGDTITRRFAVDPALLKALPALRAFVSGSRWQRLIRYVGSYDAAPLIYIQTILPNRIDAPPDPQTALHADTFHATVKAWFFLTDVDEEDGPFVYVAGSHRVDARRLVWERRRSRDPDALDRLSSRGSFRIDPDELALLGLPAPQAFAVPANTLVVADTHGFHARGMTSRRSIRVEIWAFQRRNPFLPWIGFDILGLPGMAERRIPFWWWLGDRLQRWVVQQWRDVGVKRPTDE
jgi:hypothetical protein